MAAYISAPVLLALLVLTCFCVRRRYHSSSDDALAAAAALDSSKRMSNGSNGHSGESNGGSQGGEVDGARSRGWTNSGGSSNGSARVFPSSRCPESSPVGQGSLGNGSGLGMGVVYERDWAAMGGATHVNGSKPEPKQEGGNNGDIDGVFACTSRNGDT